MRCFSRLERAHNRFRQFAQTLTTPPIRGCKEQTTKNNRRNRLPILPTLPIVASMTIVGKFFVKAISWPNQLHPASKNMRILNRWSVFAALASVCVAATAQADVITLNVNSALSSLTLSGDAFGLAYTPQATGALTANYAGTITANLTAGIFTFSGGSAINALVNPSGPYTTIPNPIGIEAGNYGVTASGVVPFYGFQTINGVYKDIVLDLSAGTAQNGAATTATFKFTSNLLDYGADPVGLVGTSNLATKSGSNTSLSNVTWDGTTLTIPVEFKVSGDNRNQTWTGTIVAAVPEPSSFGLMSLVGMVGLFRKRSRNRVSLLS